MRQVGRRMQPDLVQPVQDDPPADPQHRDGAHDRQRGQQLRHGAQQQSAKPACRFPRSLGQVQAHIVHLHDQRHRAIDHHRDRDAHQRQHHPAGHKRFGGDLVQRDGHDLAREDQIGADRAGSALLLERHRILDHVLDRLAVLRPAQLLHHLLRALIAEERAAQHQQPDDRRWQELAQDQRPGQQDQQLVPEAALGDGPDDRQLARRGKAGDIARGDRRIVDHHAGGLGARLARRHADIVDRCRRSAGHDRHVIQRRRSRARDGGDIVEQRRQTTWQGNAPSVAGRGWII